MVSVNTSYYPATFANAAQARTTPTTLSSPPTAASVGSGRAAANVTLSDAAALALDERPVISYESPR